MCTLKVSKCHLPRLMKKDGMCDLPGSVKTPIASRAETFSMHGLLGRKAPAAPPPPPPTPPHEGCTFQVKQR
jgi:hypothetical protein